LGGEKGPFNPEGEKKREGGKGEGREMKGDGAVDNTLEQKALTGLNHNSAGMPNGGNCRFKTMMEGAEGESRLGHPKGKGCLRVVRRGMGVERAMKKKRDGEVKPL